MEESILKSVKNIVQGLVDYDNGFDQDLCLHINSTLFTLRQLLPDDVYQQAVVVDETTKWNDLIIDESSKFVIPALKQYVELKVSKVFDPPSSSSLVESYNEVIKELEWRITNFNSI